jgi:hypothetical protein
VAERAARLTLGERTVVQGPAYQKRRRDMAGMAFWAKDSSAAAPAQAMASEPAAGSQAQHPAQPAVAPAAAPASAAVAHGSDAHDAGPSAPARCSPPVDGHKDAGECSHGLYDDILVEADSRAASQAGASAEPPEPPQPQTDCGNNMADTAKPAVLASAVRLPPLCRSQSSPPPLPSSEAADEPPSRGEVSDVHTITETATTIMPPLPPAELATQVSVGSVWQHVQSTACARQPADATWAAHGASKRDTADVAGLPAGAGAAPALPSPTHSMEKVHSSRPGSVAVVQPAPVELGSAASVMPGQPAGAAGAQPVQKLSDHAQVKSEPSELVATQSAAGEPAGRAAPLDSQLHAPEPPPPLPLSPAPSLVCPEVGLGFIVVCLRI